MATFSPRYASMLTIALLVVTALLPAHAKTIDQPIVPGCTTFYAYDGETALAGNNEDFNNPLTFVWFIPASAGRYGRAYFGYDDGIPQGGVNDQGVFFDALALPYKDMPATSQRPHFPGGDLALYDEILSHSQNVREAIDISARWNRLAGEYAQFMYGDRFGDSVILDGDTVIRKEGPFQVATNFRLSENPNPPYPQGEERYAAVSDMLSKADRYTVDLFRDALDVAHAEGETPTLYSQVYELNIGKIHLYQFHDFQHEVVLDLAEELAKGHHVLRIASLFPANKELEEWTFAQTIHWKSRYQSRINTKIQPASLSWMSGQYLLQNEGEARAMKVYLENDQLYLQQSDQLPIELYPIDSDTVFHHFFNGMDLTLNFRRPLWGEASGAKGTFSFDPYEIAIPYDLSRAEAASTSSPWIVISGVSLGLTLFGALALVLRRKWRS